MLTPVALGQQTDSPASPMPQPYQGGGTAVEGPFYDDSELAQPEKGPAAYGESSSARGVFSLGLDFDRGLGIDLSYTHLYNRFFATEYSARYAAYNEQQSKDTFYGADIQFIFLLSNPTIITPYLGLGPGYEGFQQTQLSETYRRGDALTVSHSFGANIDLSQTFMMQLGQRTTRYFGGAPYESFTKQTALTERKELIIRFVVRI